MQQKKLRAFIESFDEGNTYQIAALKSGLAQSDTLARYWNLLEMERAVRLSKEYFDRLIEMAA